MKIECGTCHIEKPKREIKRIGHNQRCKSCDIKKRRKHREFLKRNILGIRKRENKSPKPPKIKGQKKTGKGSKNPYLGIYLTKVEKYIIYKKYSSLGYDSASIKNKYIQIKKHFDKMISKGKKRKIDEVKMNRRFKEEFAKLMMGD